MILKHDGEYSDVKKQLFYLQDIDRFLHKLHIIPQEIGNNIYTVCQKSMYLHMRTWQFLP